MKGLLDTSGALDGSNTVASCVGLVRPPKEARVEAGWLDEML